MQTEERSTCPSCGGDNPKAAAFCWRCYANLPAAAATGAPRPAGSAAGVASPTFGRLGVDRMPSPPPIPAPPATNNGASTFARIAVGAAAAMIALFGVRAVLDRGPTLPDVVAGTPRITTQEMRDFEAQLVEEGEGSNLDVAAGVYGTGPVPSFIVLLVEGRTSEATDDIFSQFVMGMSSGGATVDESATVSGELEGLEYRCVPVGAAQTPSGGVHVARRRLGRHRVPVGCRGSSRRRIC